MKSEFNEFTYAYAVTEDIIRHLSTTLTAAPFIPSLREEGATGGGYDLRLSQPGYAIFYQYKVAERIGKHGKLWKDFGNDYYRFKIWASKNSDQQQLLLDLENSGEQVFYAAPRFYKNSELNTYYSGQSVASNSIYIKPSQIGILTDIKEHYWAYDSNGIQFFCSVITEKKIDTTMTKFLEEIPSLRGDFTLLQKLEDSRNRLQETVRKMNGFGILDRVIQEQPLMNQVETLARCLGCGTIIVTSDTEELK